MGANESNVSFSSFSSSFMSVLLYLNSESWHFLGMQTGEGKCSGEEKVEELSEVIPVWG